MSIINMMFDFSSAGIRVLVGVVVIILGFMVLRFMSADGEETITEYAAPVPKRKIGILKNPKKVIRKIEMKSLDNKQSWAPSPVDATMSPHGEWDTNRFPSNFVTNVASGFPENDEGYSASAARPTKWTPPTPSNFSVPDLTMQGELGPMAGPPIGYEDPYSGEAGFAEL